MSDVFELVFVGQALEFRPESYKFGVFLLQLALLIHHARDLLRHHLRHLLAHVGLKQVEEG